MSASDNGRPAQGRAAIAFKGELERLREQRRTPELTREYTIGGSIEQSVHRELDAQRERDIARINNRLREAKGHANNEFGVSQHRARARRDFERSR